MNKIKETEVFKTWMRNLKDVKGRAVINARIRRLSFGNIGDTKPVGEGIFELRIGYGPGYRIYYIWAQQEIIVLLCGGDKSSQSKDIEAAKQIARNLEAIE
jgi:putative addiction module killer protein